MKVVLFNGSPRKEGNTSICLKIVMDELEKEGIECDYIWIGMEKLQGCTACGKCGENKDQKCVLPGDKMNEYIEKIIQANGIIIGSPTYYGLLSGKIKSFIDESIRVHGKLQGKVGGVFTSSGGVASGAETTLISLIQAMLVHGMIVQGRAKRQHYGMAAVRTPIEEEIAACEEYGAWIVELVLKVQE